MFLVQLVSKDKLTGLAAGLPHEVRLAKCSKYETLLCACRKIGVEKKAGTGKHRSNIFWEKNREQQRMSL
jgi:hypothetical protein